MEEKFAQELLEKNRETYNLIAEEFSGTRWKIWPEYHIFRDYIKDGDKILDIGCGNGRLLDLFEDRKIEYLGIDSSENQVQEAKKKYPDYAFLTADALGLPFSNGTFDKVFLVAVLHNVPSRELRLRILKEGRRVLKADGLFILTVWSLWRPEALRLILKYSLLKIMGRSEMDWGDVFVPWGKKAERYYHFFTQAEITRLAKEAGFKVLESGLAKNENGQRSNLYLICQSDQNKVLA
jgi:ubiquinone/menaquinone biosynthesis C-methylase UbiE